MTRQLTADQHNEFLEIGRLIDETTFKREKKSIYLADMEAMLDMVTKKDGIYYIAEIKKSSKTLESGIFQLKYYLYLLKKRKGIDIKGIIKIPKEKISKNVVLTNDDEVKISNILKEMEKVISLAIPPKLKKRLKFCSTCAHLDFCWS